MARTHLAHAVAHDRAVEAARPAARAIAAGKHHRVALAQRHHDRARLHARPLFDEHELAAGEVALRFGQEHRDLKGEKELAVEILVQAVEVARAVAQQQRRRQALPGRVRSG